MTGTCSCTVVASQRESAIARSMSGYAVYLDAVDDGTTFDPSCPFHGESGSMVITVGASVDDTPLRGRSER